MRYFLYNLKIILKNRDGIPFWVIVFPFILATLFFVAFSNLDASTTFSTMNLAIIKQDDSMNYQIYSKVLDEIKDEESNQKIFNVTTTEDSGAAEELLNNNEVVGIVRFEDENPKMIVKQNGIEQTIAKNVLVSISDQIKLGGQTQTTKINNTYETELDSMVVEYISVLAMACLYSSLLSAFVTGNNLPNTTMRGRRLAVSSTSKFKILMTGLLVCAIIQIVGIGLLFVYLSAILKINFGPNLGLVFLSLIIGSFAGLSLGALVSAAFRCSEMKKSGIIIIYTMVGCFLAGMMNPAIKYLVDTNCGIINKINPVALIVDGIYSAAQYGGTERYWTNIIILSVFAVVFTTTAIIAIRRQKYDSL